LISASPEVVLGLGRAEPVDVEEVVSNNYVMKPHLRRSNRRGRAT